MNSLTSQQALNLITKIQSKVLILYRERICLKAILGSYYKLSDENIESLILEAEDVVQDSAQIYGFTKLVKDTYENDQRIELIEMLWEVVFADGKADAFEQNLIQRVAGLIFVSDKDRGLARKRVIDRLGINA